MYEKMQGTSQAPCTHDKNAHDQADVGSDDFSLNVLPLLCFQMKKVNSRMLYNMDVISHPLMELVWNLDICWILRLYRSICSMYVCDH